MEFKRETVNVCIFSLPIPCLMNVYDFLLL